MRQQASTHPQIQTQIQIHAQTQMLAVPHEVRTQPESDLQSPHQVHSTDAWEENKTLLEKSDLLARLGWKLEAAIRCISKEESLQTLLQFTLEQRLDKVRKQSHSPIWNCLFLYFVKYSLLVFIME